MNSETLETFAQGIWGALGVMLVLFGLAWLLAGRLASPARRAINLLAAFNLLEGSAMVLVGLRSQLPFLLGYTLPDLVVVVAYVLLWRAAAALAGLPDSRREQAWVVVVGIAAQLPFSTSPADFATAQALALLANAWAAARGGWQAAHKYRLGGSPIIAAGTLACAFGMALPLAWLALDNMFLHDHGHPGASMAAWAALGAIGLVCGFVCNVLVAYLVFGRVVRELNRLSETDPLTGMPGASVAERALAFEWEQRLKHREPLALASIVVDGIDGLRESFGRATADLVVAEVALQVQPMLRAGDLLAHEGDGRFVALMPAASARVAHGIARAMVMAVACEPGLHPEARQFLTLSVGLVTSSEVPDAAALQHLARGRRDAAAQAGGNAVYAGLPAEVQAAPRALRGTRLA